MKAAAENAAPKQRGTPFKPGQSGNPAGKPKGARNKTTLAMEAIMEADAEAMTRKLVELANAGDMTAMRICMDRLYPARRDRAVTFDLPKIETAADLTKATQAIMEAVATGDLTPLEADAVSRTVEAHVKAIEVTDLMRRLEALEGKP
ncbi:MAG: hypothetical protein J0I42_20240 [Bosea sp.]|uniref:DUF5681 domain-containing protein n=1 Tax=Bosea sp. (in: a-proteobacteria) TaxID=1871050 RepID=UPI001AC20662|nr:DUF5681 domain-containing protein [Bosea sp. (in: a-proteobacteria)]MBN9454273.1 hypothetical protein [Bosea sp. (in: a-proteobacteria)]